MFGLVIYVDFMVSLLEYVFDDSNPVLVSDPAVIVELISGLCEGFATGDESFDEGFEASVWHVRVADYEGAKGAQSGSEDLEKVAGEVNGCCEECQWVKLHGMEERGLTNILWGWPRLLPVPYLH